MASAIGEGPGAAGDGLREAVRSGASGLVVVDVRSPGEFAAGHVEGARNIPVSEISRRTKELGPTDRPIVLYCASGSRSAMAKRTLRGAGYSKVYNLGSMRNW